MDHFAPRTRRDIRARELVVGMLVHVLTTWTMLFSERRKIIDRLNSNFIPQPSIRITHQDERRPEIGMFIRPDSGGSG
jgi:hypothetical protein